MGVSAKQASKQGCWDGGYASGVCFGVCFGLCFEVCFGACFAAMFSGYPTLLASATCTLAASRVKAKQLAKSSSSPCGNAFLMHLARFSLPTASLAFLKVAASCSLQFFSFPFDTDSMEQDLGH